MQVVCVFFRGETTGVTRDLHTAGLDINILIIVIIDNIYIYV